MNNLWTFYCYLNLFLLPLLTMSLNSPTSPILKAATVRARKSAIQAFEPLGGEGEGNDDSAQQPASMPRGGGDFAKEEPEKSPEEHKNEALREISGCYKYALAAGFFGAASLVFDNRATLLQGEIASIPLLLIIEIVVTAQQVIFGLGLYQAHKIFQQGTKGGTRLDANSVHRVGKVLSRMWVMAAYTISVDTLAMACTFEPIWIRSLTGILLGANIPICRGFHREVSLRSHKQTPAKPEFQAGRESGLKAARNMLFCVAALVISGVIDIVQAISDIWGATELESKVGSLISGLMDIAESVAIVGLLVVLYQQFIRATVTATQEQSSKRDSFVGYFQAQKKFYSKIGSFFSFQLLFTILPYAVAGLQALLIYMGLNQYAKYLG